MTHRWYIVHCYSGFEKKVENAIRERAEASGMTEQICQVLVPSEKVMEMRGGKQISTDRKFFPGYVLVHMELTDATWHLVKDTPKVSGFLGAGNRPRPIPDSEAARIISQVQEGVERPRPSITFEIGESVRVADGPFTSFNGTVQEIDENRARLKVAVLIFGRPTPVELEYTQVEKT
ncbi:MAG: transcription termination/antitermination protein NusG [bacterium]|nr:transcription termination/antitermination protein NusG [bacterium]MDE0240073.1 transcription termination/antitermination protein NusG [bacterium]MDE0416466.1 transcription termination/antitermination protein NusG [bacterium]